MKNILRCIVLSFLLVGCTKISGKALLSTVNNPSYITQNSATAVSHTLTGVNIAVISGSTNLALSLSVNTNASGFSSLQNFCGTGTTNPCQCELVWNELNTVGNSSQTIQRTRRFSVTEVQPGLVKCTMTQSFWDEIPDATVIKMNIIPVVQSGNLTALACQSINYKKGTLVSSSGDFFDSTLTPFRNILHYSCYSRRAAAHEITSNVQQTTVDNNGVSQTVDYVMASNFCSDITGGGSGCNIPRNGYSAQSYYRNLYVKSDKVGTINSHNDKYDCPKVEESIKYSAGNTSQPSSEAGKYWPLDSNFALSSTYSSEWSVPVAAPSVLYKVNDPDSQQDGLCSGEVSGKRLQETNIATKCLGYAKPPKPDGTCGSIVDSNGRVRPLVRLRKYRAIYPPSFKANGQPETAAIEADEVYVADRLVVNNLGVPTNEMIYGPKPCNFAWFDHEGVTSPNSSVRPLSGSTTMNFESRFAGGRPGYVATNQYYYKMSSGVELSVNPDGLILPNTDLVGTYGSAVNPPSCSATIPVVEQVMGSPSLVRLITLNKNRTDVLPVGSRVLNLSEVHIRPIDPWTPDYLEDRTFQACVPVSDTYTEPPLHFYSKTDSNNTPYMAWCSMSYPTQNPYWAELNKKRKPQNSIALTTTLVGYPNPNPVSPPDPTGAAKRQVDHWTSFSGTVIPNQMPACAGTLTVCSSTSTPAELANCKAFLGENSASSRCDRTIRFESSQDFRAMPLQARAVDIDNMLSNDLLHDKTYGCTYSVSSDATKVGKKIPTSGCCGIYQGAAVLGTSGGPPWSLFPVNGTAKSGHLEPYYNPAFPDVRFCGNPVQ